MVPSTAPTSPLFIPNSDCPFPPPSLFCPFPFPPFFLLAHALSVRRHPSYWRRLEMRVDCWCGFSASLSGYPSKYPLSIRWFRLCFRVVQFVLGDGSVGDLFGSRESVLLSEEMRGGILGFCGIGCFSLGCRGNRSKRIEEGSAWTMISIHVL